MTYEELFDQVKSGKIVGAKLTEEYWGLKSFRFFISTGNRLCYFSHRSRRRGPYFRPEMMGLISEYTYSKEKPSAEMRVFKGLKKLKKLAKQATFSNVYIERCLALPDTFEQWLADGAKNAYEYHICDSHSAKTVTIANIEKHYCWIGQALREAIKNRTKYDSAQFNFRGYDTHVGVSPNPENNTMQGYLSMEFRGMGNGHYYWLINDTHFVFGEDD